MSLAGVSDGLFPDRTQTIVKRLSTETSERVESLSKSLKTFIFEVETKGHLDTQLAVFRTEKLAKELGMVFLVHPSPFLNLRSNSG